MEPSDADMVSRLEQECFSMPWTRQGFLDALSEGNALFLVAESAAQIIGYCGMYFAMDEGEITNVAVSPGMRGCGVGTALLSCMKREAERRGIARIFLEVRLSNATAIRLYERQGFSVLGIRKGFYEAPREDAYVMKCSLSEDGKTTE